MSTRSAQSSKVSPDSSASSQADRPAALKETIMTPDGQVVQITTKPAPTPRGVPNPSVNAKTRKRHRIAVTAALLDPDELVKEQVNGFVRFIREHAIVGLAVGFIIATQAQAVIKQLVSSFIDPVIILFGGTSLNELKVTAELFGNHADFTVGAMIYSLINLLAVLLAIYILIKTLKLDKLDQPAK